MFDQQNARADEVLRSIVASLPEAVATCVDAAGEEFNVPRQTALLKVQPIFGSGCSIPSSIYENNIKPELLDRKSISN